MTCREARRRLSDYLDDGLELSIRRELIDHLDACPACSEEQRLLAATRRLLSACGASPCPVDLTPLATRTPLRVREQRSISRVCRGLAAASAAVALIAVSWQWQRSAGERTVTPPAPHRVVVRDVAEVEELHRSFAVQQSLGTRDGLVLFAPEWAERAP
jgi:anti-sigma factor RsiW